WVESLTPVTCEATNAPAGAPPGMPMPPGAGAGPGGGGRMGPRSRGPRPGAGPAKEICSVTLKCRGVNLQNAGPSANAEAAYAVTEALKKSGYFDPNGVALPGTIAADDFTFVFE